MELWRSQSGAKRTTERERAETSTTRRVLAEQPQLIHFAPKKKSRSPKLFNLPDKRVFEAIVLEFLSDRTILVNVERAYHTLIGVL